MQSARARGWGRHMRKVQACGCNHACRWVTASQHMHCMPPRTSHLLSLGATELLFALQLVVQLVGLAAPVHPRACRQLAWPGDLPMRCRAPERRALPP